jgi:acyl-ACP thioesterase
MGNLVLQAANDDADMLGFGVRDLNSGNASWVLSRMAVEMRRLPSRHERIDIYTWVSDYGRLFTTRNMTIADEAGAEIGAAVTLWAMIDLDTRRPLDLSPLSNKGTSLVDREPPIERPRKVGTFDRDAAASYSEHPYRVVYSDIDFNGHVNSMKYLEWMVDTLPAEAHAGLDALRFDINYLHEARLGEELLICSGEIPNTGHYFDIRNAEGTSICKATITKVRER